MLGATLEHRLTLLVFGLALGIELVQQLADPRPARLRVSQPRRQLVAARVAVELVLGRIDLGGLFEDLPGELLVGLVLKPRRVGRDLGRIDRDDPGANQPRPMTHRQHLSEQPRQRPFVLGAKARNRGVIGRQIRRHHPKRDVLHTAALDRARRSHPGRIASTRRRSHRPTVGTTTRCSESRDRFVANSRFVPSG